MYSSMAIKTCDTFNEMGSLLKTYFIKTCNETVKYGTKIFSIISENKFLITT